MYETSWWGGLVKVWEVIVYNSVMDLQQCWQVRPAPCCLHFDMVECLEAGQTRTFQYCVRFVNVESRC